MNPYDVPELRPGVDFRLCWACGYYDGPLSGVCERDGRPHWFEFAHPDHEEVRNRWYLAYPLTDDEGAEEEMHYHSFRMRVGEHYDFDGSWHRPIRQATMRDMDAFYSTREAWEERTYTDREPVFGFWRRPTRHRKRARSRRYWDRKVPQL